MRKKVQISIEYILITGFIFVILTGLMIYAYSEANRTITLNKAEESVINLVKIADIVHTLGEGNQALTWINVPGAIESFEMTGRNLNLDFHIQEETTGVHYRSLAQLNGTLPTTQGSYRIRATAINSSHVHFDIK